MSKSEFSRMIKARPLPGESLTLEANRAELDALAQRFAIPQIERLTATIELAQSGKAIRADGTWDAELMQACAISGEDFAQQLSEGLAFRFVPKVKPTEEPDIEIELDTDDLDEIEYDGDQFDLGEAIAQSLGLAIDPYAEGPDADMARKKAGIISDENTTGALADALAALKKD